jgi:hypothetical protein
MVWPIAVTPNDNSSGQPYLMMCKDAAREPCDRRTPEKVASAGAAATTLAMAMASASPVAPPPLHRLKVPNATVSKARSIIDSAPPRALSSVRETSNAAS